MREAGQPPLGIGSVSIGLYLEDMHAVPAVDELLAQAVLAEEAGFDGVTLSEHHGGAPGYAPNPLLLSNWVLEAMHTAWSGPCPMILPVRPTALIVEDLAWTAARFPHRVAAGFVPGFLEEDFVITGSDHATRSKRFRDGLAEIAAYAAGAVDDALTGDRAVRHLSEQGLTMVSAAIGTSGARRAAGVGMGLLIATFCDATQSAEITAEYQDAGGTGPRVLVKRAHLGPPPQRQRTRTTSDSWLPAQKTDMIREEDPGAMVERLAEVFHASDATAYNLRLQLPDGNAEQTRTQIARFAEVLPALKDALKSRRAA